ncbi:hypothetical protein MMC24_002136 [Lignoscripta atroalba]|nr:hypothetical protein [Lignoscripta atroalba]
MPSLRIHPRHFILQARSTSANTLGKRDVEFSTPLILLLVQLALLVLIACIFGVEWVKQKLVRGAGIENVQPRASVRAPGANAALVPRSSSSRKPNSATAAAMDITPESVAAVQALKLAAFPGNHTAGGQEDDAPPEYVSFDANLPGYEILSEPSRVAGSESQGGRVKTGQEGLRRESVDGVRLYSLQLRSEYWARAQVHSPAQAVRESWATGRLLSQRQIEREERRNREMESEVIIW